MRRRLIALTALAVLSIFAAACGLPTDDDFQSIDQSDDGFGLWQTSTTTTSTTLPPTTTIDATTSTTIELTTTSISTEQVDIYFPTGRDLAPVQFPLPIDPTLTLVMESILGGPPPVPGLRAILPRDADVTVEGVDGVAIVDFPAGLFDEMTPSDQRLVFGQIVLTLSKQRGVGQVRFTQAGEPMQVFLGNGSATSPGDTVSRDDYTNLLGGSGDPIQTTTTTIATTVPPTDPPTDETTTQP